MRLDFKNYANDVTYFFTDKYFWFLYKLIKCEGIPLPYLTLKDGRNASQEDLIVESTDLVKEVRKKRDKENKETIKYNNTEVEYDPTGISDLYRRIYDNTWSGGHKRGLQNKFELTCFIEPTCKNLYGGTSDGFSILGFIFEYHDEKSSPKIKPLNKNAPEYEAFISPKTKSARIAPAGRKRTKDPTPFGR